MLYPTVPAFPIMPMPYPDATLTIQHRSRPNVRRLADYVTHHELAADGPIREYYLVGPSDTPDESLWRTEVGWPIFQTRART
jgi:hypothetical protein